MIADWKIEQAPDHSHYIVDGEEFDITSGPCKIGGDSAPLIGWAFKLGYAGTLEVLKEEIVQNRDENDWPQVSEMFGLLKAKGKTPNQMRDKGGDRGTAVHDVLEELAQTGTRPDLDKYEGDVRGHIESLLGWYDEYEPKIEAVEVCVASKEYRYAGRYDLRCRISAEKLGFTDREGDLLVLVDLKTSKSVYKAQHFAQLAAYELASVEMGYPNTDCQYVLLTNGEGKKAKFVRSTGKPSHFVAFLAAHRAKRELEGK